MNEKIKTICLIFITLAIIIGIGFHCWGIYKEQRYYSQKQDCIEKCVRESKDIIQNYSDRLKVCNEACDYEFIRSKIISN